MEVTRQLRVDRVTKTGLAPIMLTCWWDNQRLRLMPSEKCLPRTYPTFSWLNYKIVRTLVGT
ncbi:MAG: hypothetical protein EOO61_03170 [Hymenobacter sp.]|nr:MAG: hypothetical protein EOO61_03170 [Hymenobacter sp.]